MPVVTLGGHSHCHLGALRGSICGTFAPSPPRVRCAHTNVFNDLSLSIPAATGLFQSTVVVGNGDNRTGGIFVWCIIFLAKPVLTYSVCQPLRTRTCRCVTLCTDGSLSARSKKEDHSEWRWLRSFEAFANAFRVERSVSLSQSLCCLELSR